MNELEHDGVAPEPTPDKTHDAEPSPQPPVAPQGTAAPKASGADSATVAASEPELEPPPVWEDPNEPSESIPEHSDDAWAFLQQPDSPELDEAPPAPEKEPAGALERALSQRLFRPDLGQLLAGVERALGASTSRKKSALPLLRLVSRARIAAASESQLLEVLLRAHASGRVADDFGLLSALLARRLVLPSLRAARRGIESSTRQRLLRELQLLVSRVTRARGEHGLRELVRLSARIGAAAAERGRPLTELVSLLARRMERTNAISARPRFESEARGSTRTRRLRLPGRVEIVIYEE
jgi:hypothetical protein